MSGKAILSKVELYIQGKENKWFQFVFPTPSNTKSGKCLSHLSTWQHHHPTENKSNINNSFINDNGVLKPGKR